MIYAKKIFTFILMIAFAGNALAEVVRIRLVKNLETFPTITKAKVSRLNDRLWSLKGVGLIYNGAKLSTSNFIVENENRTFDIVGQFDFDRYLAGVVASEMPDTWPAEALKAQAIVARSFALSRMNERKEKIYQLESDQMDQVFRATESKSALTAVHETKNIVLRNQLGQILKAFFHADCGGQTIPASKVWNTELDTGTAVDPWCRNRKSNEWSFEISDKQFFKTLKQDSNGEVTSASTFAQKLQSFRAGGAIFSVQKLRQIFGFAKIKNSPEKLAFEGEKIIFSGKGFGHGVGLCQWGAREQAKRGVGALEIIRHYYPQASITEGEQRLQLVSR